MGSGVLAMIVDVDVVGSIIDPKVSVTVRNGSIGFMALPGTFKRRLISCKLVYGGYVAIQAGW